MTNKTTLIKSLPFFIMLFCVVNFGYGQSQIIISQYIETSSGTTPKGIEIYNISGVDITFTVTNNLRVYQGTNGGTCNVIPGINITNGTLLANEVWVIGTANLTTFANSNGSNLSGTTDFNFQFNGDDALQLYLGGVIQDAFGTCGTDPGSAWTGGGVSTANYNLQIINGLCDGNITGWSDPSTRFDQIADGLVMTGFGNAPAACCLNSSTWTAGTWVPSVPNKNTSVTITGTYNTDAINGSFSACSLTVNGNLIVNDGYFIEVENDVVVDGPTASIRVETNGAFIQRGDNTSAGTFSLINGGTSNVFKFTATKQQWYYYTYWSSPVENETVDGAFPDTDLDRRFLFNAAIYLDSNGDGIDETPGWQIANGGDTLIPGVGYAATSGPFGLYPGTDSADFNGTFNTGDIPAGISYNALNIGGSWNFIGNPYPGALDFDAFQAANSTIVDGAAYFWSQASPPLDTNPGNEVLNFNQNDYAVYTVGSGGVAGGSPDIPTQYVPSAQGFFVAGLSNANATFTNSMRMADATSNNLFFKTSNKQSKSNNSNANKLWINLTSDNGIFGQILIAYVDGATNGNDGLSYDAPKLLSDNASILYSTIEGSNKIFAIQGKAETSLSENEVIKLGFDTRINVPTIYTLSVAHFQGDFLSNNNVFLKDNLLNTLHDLSASDYNFTSDVGEFTNRFEIVFNSEALSNTDLNADANSLSILQVDDTHVRFTASNNLTIKTVAIYDLLGRQLYQLEGSHNEETYNLSNLNHSVFIAKIELSNGALITKKAIKK